MRLLAGAKRNRAKQLSAQEAESVPPWAQAHLDQRSRAQGAICGNGCDKSAAILQTQGPEVYIDQAEDAQGKIADLVAMG